LACAGPAGRSAAPSTSALAIIKPFIVLSIGVDSRICQSRPVIDPAMIDQ
jgi:hypothetical protein